MSKMKHYYYNIILIILKLMFLKNSNGMKLLKEVNGN